MSESLKNLTVERLDEKLNGSQYITLFTDKGKSFGVSFNLKTKKVTYEAYNLGRRVTSEFKNEAIAHYNKTE